MSRKDTGIKGELLARNYLENHGYCIVENNYRCSHGEVDIIAIKDDCLVFIEVRTKTGNDFGSPRESVTATKKARLIATAQHYQQTHEALPAQWRIDFVGVELARQSQPHIEIIENAISENLE